MTILMLGKQIELGHYRAEFLKSHGIGVIFPETERAAYSMIESGGFDAVIVSYTLSENTATELVRLVKQTCPDCPLIAITNKRWDGFREFQPDETVLDTDPPAALIDALVRVERKRMQDNQSESQIRRVK